jgi:hypothetical protein
MQGGICAEGRRSQSENLLEQRSIPQSVRLASADRCGGLTVRPTTTAKWPSTRPTLPGLLRVILVPDERATSSRKNLLGNEIEARITREQIAAQRLKGQWKNSAMRMITGIGTPRKSNRSERMEIS